MSKLGLGCMGMSGVYGTTDDNESVRTIEHAIERGVTLIDTGDFYGMGHNELLIARAIKGKREQVQLSVKFGAQRGPDGAWLGFDGRPAAVKTWCAYSLKRLGVEAIDIYRPARLDPAVPIEDTVGAVSDLVKAGYVKAIGLSEVGVQTIRRAAKVHPIVDLQIEYSLASRKPEERIFPALRELAISATLYGVFSRGLLTGSKPDGKGDFRSWLPRFANLGRNQKAIDDLAILAKAHQCSSAQLLLAWVLAKQPGFTPVIGVKNIQQLDEGLKAETIRLSEADLAQLEERVPPTAIVGSRYADEQMKHLDSER